MHGLPKENATTGSTRSAIALSLFLTLFYLPSLPLSAKRRSFWHWPDKFLTLNIEVRESLGSKFALKF
ncbi:hypothetical protein QYF36_014505 [Acer negundo]|nr:hypothetical protein QYF36_014505 [Acer negundo]